MSFVPRMCHDTPELDEQLGRGQQLPTDGRPSVYYLGSTQAV